ncbi:MAG: hypothetical protein GC146_11740 [Limimaricola sp.]|uniref:hypothetical protein n=1 Tax=Limimaricola sp. TaxID=2211665 RepID=UPI001DED52E6|nr:hypothetical protein [Limimaricola sp.]MBI1417885.1 hypothetical protein [Limimaricola sp.]
MADATAWTGVNEPNTNGVGRLGRALLLWYMFVIFSVFSLRVSGLTVTCFFAAPAAAVMMFRNLQQVSARELLPLFILWIVAVVSVFLGYDTNFFSERTSSLLLFTYSLVMVYGLRLEIGRATRADIAWLSGWLMWGILAAATLEVLGPLRTISDAFRAWNSNIVYASDSRDLVLTGFLRPKVFTQEPSYVAIGQAVFSYTWYLTTRSRDRIGLFILVTLATFYLERSPISAISMIPIATSAFTDLAAKRRGLRQVIAMYLAGLLVLVALLVGGFALQAILEARNQSSGSFGDQSLMVRIQAPPMTAFLVFQKAPLFGAGIGGRDAIASEVQYVFDRLGIIPTFLNSAVADAIPNAFWEHWIYFGVLGGLTAGFAIVSYFRMLCGRRCGIAWIFLLLLSNSFGAYTTPRFWSYATLVLIATSASRQATSTRFSDRS